MSGSIVRTTRTYEVEQLKLLTTCLFKKKKENETDKREKETFLRANF